MSYRVLPAAQAFWRPSNQLGVQNSDLAKQLEATTIGARLWRLEPGQASTRHRHRSTTELYVVLEGTGRLRVAAELLTLAPLGSVLVEPSATRHLFNDTATDQRWLVVGAPPEPANTLEMSAAELDWIYPDGPKALPAELQRARADARIIPPRTRQRPRRIHPECGSLGRRGARSRISRRCQRRSRLAIGSERVLS